MFRLESCTLYDCGNSLLPVGETRALFPPPHTPKCVICSNYRLGLININGLTTNWNLLRFSHDCSIFISFAFDDALIFKRNQNIFSMSSSCDGCRRHLQQFILWVIEKKMFWMIRFEWETTCGTLIIRHRHFKDFFFLLSWTFQTRKASRIFLMESSKAAIKNRNN
jgi:hypothetical protein